MTAPSASVPVDKVKSLDSEPPLDPFKTARGVTVKSIVPPELFQSSIPFGSLPESVSTY